MRKDLLAMSYPKPGNPLGVLIRDALEAAGLSTAEGARLVGVSRQTLHGYMTKPSGHLRIPAAQRARLVELDILPRQIELAAAHAAGYAVERFPPDIVGTAILMVRLDEYDRADLRRDVARRLRRSRRFR